jgi:hypothetical protein
MYQVHIFCVTASDSALWSPEQSVVLDPHEAARRQRSLERNMVSRDGPIWSCLGQVPAGANVASRDRPVRSCPEAVPVGVWLECVQAHQYDVAPE